MNRSRLLRGGAALAVLFALGGCAHFVVLRDALSASEHNDLGVVYEAGGQPSLAMAEYRKSLRLEPHQSSAWINRGNLDAAAGRWPAAEKCFRRALKEAPADGDAANNLAVALLHQGRSRDARGFALAAVAAGGERDSVYRATLDEIDRAGPQRSPSR